MWSLSGFLNWLKRFSVRQFISIQGWQDCKFHTRPMIQLAVLLINNYRSRWLTQKPRCPCTHSILPYFLHPLCAKKKFRPFIRLTSPSRKNGVGRFLSLSASEAANQLWFRHPWHRRGHWYWKLGLNKSDEIFYCWIFSFWISSKMDWNPFLVWPTIWHKIWWMRHPQESLHP